MLTLHFLNVGKGSSTIVEFPREQRVGVIDIDDSQSFNDEDLDNIAQLVGKRYIYKALTSLGMFAEARKTVEEAYSIPLCDPVQYYLQNIGNQAAFRFILTHPDMDHMSGLDRLCRTIGMLNLWDTENDKTVDGNSWEDSPYRKADWDCYQRLRQSNEAPKCIRPVRGDLGKYWDEDCIEILSPSQKLVKLASDTGEYDHLSYVLRITHAGRRVLLGGDATTEAWSEILDFYGKDALKSDILLAPHHGSKYNFHKEAMEAVGPELVIVSVHVGQDYAYDDYKKLGSKPIVLATKWWGNTVVTVNDDGSYTYKTEFAR